MQFSYSGLISDEQEGTFLQNVISWLDELIECKECYTVDDFNDGYEIKSSWLITNACSKTVIVFVALFQLA
jgi:hypothetical protein